MFRAPNIAEMLRCKCALDAVFRLQIDTWKNYRSVKAMVDHIAPLDASDCPCCDQATTSFLHELSDSYCDTCPSASFGAQEEPSNAFVESNREQWGMLAKREPQALRSELASALIGTATLHEAQALSLIHILHSARYNRHELVAMVFLAARSAKRDHGCYTGEYNERSKGINGSFSPHSRCRSRHAHEILSLIHI